HMRILPDGNVGIGTSSAYGLTHWQDSSTINLIATNTGADGQADTTVMSLIGQARGYSNNLAKLASIDFKTDPNTWYRGVMTFNVANVDGTDITKTPLEAMRIDSNGILGVGVTPNDGWGGYEAIQIGPRGSLNANSNTAVAFMGLTNNGYYDGTNWRYIAGTIPPTMFQLTPSGTFSWHQYTAGAADDIISFDEVMTLTSDGNLSFADGGGIDFSANANATGMTSELLNDYEEGAWSPVYEPTSGSFASITMDTPDCVYVKIGNLVSVSGIIRTDAVDITG
ncbi:MAG: hypothetical protein VXB01_12225, partial [Opitutae bacterium]